MATQVEEEGGWEGVGDVPGCLQLHGLHNHPVSCIDSCVSKASLPPHPLPGADSDHLGGGFRQMSRTLGPL